MKRFYFYSISISLIFLTFASFAQKSPLSYPQCRNTSGSSTPNAPSATIYIGDNGTFGCETWATLDGNWGKIRVVTSKNSDLSTASNGDWGSYLNSDAKTNTSARFTSTGTWYWAIQTDYNGNSNYWYCKNNSNWYDMWGDPTSDLTINVTALSDPTSPSATQSSISQINLSWTQWNSKNVIIVRRLTSDAASDPPAQGTAYLVGNTLGTGTVVYNGSETSFDDTGLTPGTSYTYTYYSENYSYYSAGATAEATTATQTSSTTDYFRSKATGNWSVAGTWESSPDNTNWITSTVIPGSTAASITIINSHNITLDGDVTIPGLTINSGGTFTASDATPRTLTISKSTSGTSTTLANNGTWVNGTGGSTVVFTGAPGGGDAIHAISGTNAFQNITVNKTGGTPNVGVSLGAGSTVSGTLEIGTGGFVSTAPPASFYGGNAILKFNTGTSYNVGTSDNSWSTDVVPNYITISSGTVNLNSARTATGNLLIDGGTLALNAALTIQGNWTRSSGTFTPNTQPVTLSGTTNTIIDATGGATLYDLVVSKTGGAYVSINSNLTVSHNLTISGGVLNVPSTKNLSVSGTLANSVGVAGLVVKSGGSLIASNAVEATVERYLTKYNALGDKMYHLISSPVSNQAIREEFVTTTPTAGHDFYAYDELTNMWINSRATGDIWNSSFENTFGIGKGYLVAYPSDVTKSFTGTLNTYPSGTPLVKTCTNTVGQGNGWNLLGNPFSSAIDWDYINTYGLGDGMDNALYYYDNAQQNYRYYLSKFPSTDTITLIGQRYIPAMQGFMVHAKTTGTKTVTISDAACTHVGQAKYYKSANAESNSLSLKVSANGYQDEAFIHFNEGATTAFDGEFDAFKLKSYSEKVPALYTIASDGSELAINGLPETASKSPIPVYFTTSIDGEYLFSANLQNVNSDIVYLTDNKLNQVQDLSLNPDYTFTALTTDEPNRFTLSFGTLGIDKPTASKMNIYSTTGKINILGADGKAEILVRNMLGQVVLSKSVSGSTLNTVNTSNLPAGVYVVSVVSGKQIVSEKVIISE